jgi:predicted protein tyrosine phosphatase
MIEIFPNLYIGTADDYERSVKGQENWQIVHACKEPYHRRELGYTTQGAPKNHPEYLLAHRDNRLILNLVDAPNQAYIPKEIIDAALEFIQHGLLNQKKVLVHCNMGESRSPSIGLLYLGIYTTLLPKSFLQAEEKFRNIYPNYNPGAGMRGFLASNWDMYITSNNHHSE